MHTLFCVNTDEDFISKSFWEIEKKDWYLNELHVHARTICSILGVSHNRALQFFLVGRVARRRLLSAVDTSDGQPKRQLLSRVGGLYCVYTSQKSVSAWHDTTRHRLFRQCKRMYCRAVPCCVVLCWPTLQKWADAVRHHTARLFWQCKQKKAILGHAGVKKLLSGYFVACLLSRKQCQ